MTRAKLEATLEAMFQEAQRHGEDERALALDITLEIVRMTSSNRIQEAFVLVRQYHWQGD